MLYQKYLEEVWGVLSGVAESQRESIVEAARVIADRMERDGMLYVFGCGHSHLVG